MTAPTAEEREKAAALLNVYDARYLTADEKRTVSFAIARELATAHAAGRLEALEEAQRKFGVYAMKYPAGRAWEMLEEMKKDGSGARGGEGKGDG